MRAALDVLGGWALKSGLPPGQGLGGSWDAEGATSEDDGPGEGGEHARYRAIFISDLHLGTAGCQARPLLEFLKHHPSHTLYLVRDIIDGWQ